jgi:hypothetical protein
MQDSDAFCAAGKQSCVSGSSCPDLIRASINLRERFSREMDHRVKPGDDQKWLFEN